MMTRMLLIAAAATALSAASGTVWAQAIQDANNPAPTYNSSTSPTPSTDVNPIVDGNNPAPVSAATTTGKTPPETAHIVDGNNPAPRYAASNPGAAPKATRHAKLTKHGTAVAHSKRAHAHAPSS